MDIDDPSRIGCAHLMGNGYHESGEHDQVGSGFVDLVEEGIVKSLPVRIIFRRDTAGVKTRGGCPLQGVSSRIIADDLDDPGIADRPVLQTVDNSLEVCSSARDTYSYFQHTSTPFSPAATDPIT